MAETVSSEIPRWMQQRVAAAWMGDDSVSRDIQVGAQIAQQAQQNRINNQYRQNQLESMNRVREAQIQADFTRQKLMTDEATDAELVSRWMLDPNQPPPSGLKTQKGIKLIADIQQSYAETEMGSTFAAARKAFADQIKGLDAMGALKVQQALDASQGKITPEIATLIDAETTRIKTTLSDTRVLDEAGQPYVKGNSAKPVFVQSLKTGAIHKLPPNWTDGMELVPLRDEDGDILGYGVPNSSGGITQLRQEKAVTMDPTTKAAMNLEMKAVNTWWEGLTAKEREKDATRLDLQARIRTVEEKYKAPVVQPKPAEDDFQKKYDALPSGAEYTGPDGVKRRKR